VLLSDRYGPASTTGSRRLVLEHSYQPWLELLGTFKLNGRIGLMEDLDNVGKVSGVWAVASRDAIGAGLNHVLATTRPEAPADEPQVGHAPPPTQFADAIGQKDPPRGIQSVAVHAASTPPSKSGRFHHPGNLLESLGVTRDQNQFQLRKFIGDLSEGVQADAFLGVLGAPAEPDGRAAIAKSEWTGPSEHLGVRTIVVGTIELDVPNDLYFRRIVTKLDEPLADSIALRGDPIDFSDDPSDDRGDAAVAFKGFLAKPTVDDGYRDPALRGALRIAQVKSMGA
jgi:hypothetical protein